MVSERYVITAGPSAGKTSVIRELNARGYLVAPEAARLVIDQAVSEGKDVDELRSNPAFHTMVENQDRRILDNLPDGSGILFEDRSIIDNVAYRRIHDGVPVPEDLLRTVENIQFDGIFMLERIDFKDDYARTENEEWASKIHDELWSVYEEFGYGPVEIPVQPVDQRADMIERSLYDN